MDLYTLNEALSIVNDKDEYLKLNNIKFKEHELETLRCFLNFLSSAATVEETCFFTDSFIIGYSIPQLGEEFDLLRLGENYNVNIELKSETDLEKMQEQLRRKRHYLKFLELPSIHISYASDTNRCYFLNEDNMLTETEASKCMEVMKGQQYIECHDHEDVNRYFDIKNYLISPFNTTENFLHGEYFLTSHQENIKKEIMEKNFPRKELVLIEGSAGTGKTLLLYDLILSAKKRGLHVLTIHCGILNEGHRSLRENDFSIATPKELSYVLKNNLLFDVIFVDESQRIHVPQFNDLVEYAREKEIPCVFSIDKEQCLHNKEIRSAIRDKLTPIVSDNFKLNSKIRTNISLANFIKSFFEYHVNSHSVIPNRNHEIKLKIFKEYSDAEKYIDYMCGEKGFVHLSYATSTYSSDPLDTISRYGQLRSAHKVVGQEFDKVIVAVDANFGYTTNPSKTVFTLAGNPQSYYHGAKMLFQNMTRTRKELCIVFINNPFMFEISSRLLSNN